MPEHVDPETRKIVCGLLFLLLTIVFVAAILKGEWLLAGVSSLGAAGMLKSILPSGR